MAGHVVERHEGYARDELHSLSNYYCPGYCSARVVWETIYAHKVGYVGIVLDGPSTPFQFAEGQ
jgi:hypothetical protein